MTLKGQESQAILAELQAPARPRADRTSLTSGGLPARSLRQASSGKIPLPFGHGLPGVRREQDVQTLLRGDEHPRYKRRSGNYLAVLEQDSGHGTRR